MSHDGGCHEQKLSAYIQLKRIRVLPEAGILDWFVLVFCMR